MRLRIRIPSETNFWTFQHFDETMNVRAADMHTNDFLAKSLLKFSITSFDCLGQQIVMNTISYPARARNNDSSNTNICEWNMPQEWIKESGVESPKAFLMLWGSRGSCFSRDGYGDPMRYNGHMLRQKTESGGSFATDDGCKLSTSPRNCAFLDSRHCNTVPPVEFLNADITISLNVQRVKSSKSDMRIFDNHFSRNMQGSIGILRWTSS